MSDENYSIKEILEMRFAEISNHLTDIKEECKQTNIKVGIQNGRVTKLEIWALEAQKILESSIKNISSLNKTRIKFYTALSIIIILGGTIIGLTIKAIDSKIKNGIAQALEENVSSVEIEK